MTSWPALPYSQWKDTLDTLHMWMQIVGKVKLALCPFLNQWWETAFYVTSTGMTTGAIPYKTQAFEVDFNFLTHVLTISTSKNKIKHIRLKTQSVADFYKTLMSAFKTLKIDVTVNSTPVEFPDPIPFEKDTKHTSYQKEYVEKWWRIQLQTYFIFYRFRSSFRGKSSPIHFFWGSFDLAGTRFSGKTATPPQIKGVMGKIMRFSENEENFTFGFWPGDNKYPSPAYYSYIYPAPKGLETINTGPTIAYFNKSLFLCILPYEDTRKLTNPEEEILNFLETTYLESAKLAGWDIKSLKGPVPF